MDQNIYNSDGTLLSNRTINANECTIVINNALSFHIDSEEIWIKDKGSEKGYYELINKITHMERQIEMLTLMNKTGCTEQEAYDALDVQLKLKGINNEIITK